MFAELKQQIEITVGLWLLTAITGCVIGFSIGIIAKGVPTEEARLTAEKTEKQKLEKMLVSRAESAAEAWVQKFFVYPKQYAPYVMETNCVPQRSTLSKDNAICDVQVNTALIVLSCFIETDPRNVPSKVPCHFEQRIDRVFELQARAL